MDGLEIIEELNAFCNKWGVQASDVSLNRDYRDDYCNVTFECFTLETDEEYQTRLDYEKNRAIEAEKFKIQQYNKLKKELGYE